MNIAIFVAVVFIICMIVAAQQSCCSVGRASWEAGTTYTAGEIDQTVKLQLMLASHTSTYKGIQRKTLGRISNRKGELEGRGGDLLHSQAGLYSKR
jgi:hypothetical protein